VSVQRFDQGDSASRIETYQTGIEEQEGAPEAREAHGTSQAAETAQIVPLDAPRRTEAPEGIEGGAPEVAHAAKADGQLFGSLIEQRINEPAALLSEAPVPQADLRRGLEGADARTLDRISKDLGALEEKLGALEARLQASGGAAQAPAADAASLEQAVRAAHGERPAEAPRPSPSRTESRSGTERSGRSESAGGASASQSAGGAGGAPGAAGAGRVSSGGAIEAQDEQGRASGAYTANVGEIEAAQDVAAVKDGERPYGERIQAALDLADRAIQALEAEIQAAAR
jgi:hypothetical protein